MQQCCIDFDGKFTIGCTKKLAEYLRDNISSQVLVLTKDIIVNLITTKRSERELR